MKKSKIGMKEIDSILSEIKKTDDKTKLIKKEAEELKEMKKEDDKHPLLKESRKDEYERKKMKLEAKLKKLEEPEKPVVDEKPAIDEKITLQEQDGALVIKKKRKGIKKELLESDLLSLDEKNELRHGKFYAPKEERKNVADNVKDKIRKSMVANDYKTATFVGKIAGGRKVLQCPECEAKMITAGNRIVKKKIPDEDRTPKQRAWMDLLAAVRKSPQFQGGSRGNFSKIASRLKAAGYTADDVINMKISEEESSSES